MRVIGFSVALFLLALSGTASACSFPPGFDSFRLDSTELPFSGDAPPPAEISVRSVLRGTDGGDGGSCTDAGQLILEVSESTEAEQLGYIFEFEAGGFPSLSAPESYLVPVTLEDETIGFRFIWLDLRSGSRRL